VSVNLCNCRFGKGHSQLGWVSPLNGPKSYILQCCLKFNTRYLSLQVTSVHHYRSSGLAGPGHRVLAPCRCFAGQAGEKPGTGSTVACL